MSYDHFRNAQVFANDKFKEYNEQQEYYEKVSTLRNKAIEYFNFNVEFKKCTEIFRAMTIEVLGKEDLSSVDKMICQFTPPPTHYDVCQTYVLCPICLELKKYTDHVFNGCGHSCCRACLVQILTTKNKKKCMLCNTKTTSRYYYETKGEMVLLQEFVE